MTHKQISYIKSWIRIAGYLMLGFKHVALAVILLVISEGVGIFEEWNEPK